MPDRYVVHTYKTVDDGNPTTDVFDTPLEAVVDALAKAKGLATEQDREVTLGSAGNTEIFEAYPRLGYGTVVVTKFRVEDDDA